MLHRFRTLPLPFEAVQDKSAVRVGRNREDAGKKIRLNSFFEIIDKNTGELVSGAFSFSD